MEEQDWWDLGALGEVLLHSHGKSLVLSLAPSPRNNEEKQAHEQHTPRACPDHDASYRSPAHGGAAAGRWRGG